MGIKEGFVAFGKAVSKKSPTILMFAGIVGFGMTVVMACKATPKAQDLIAKKKEEKGVTKLTAFDTVKAVTPVYWPSAVVGCGAATCIILGNSINIKRNMAVAAAYTIAEESLKEVNEKVIEKFGEKKFEEIRDDISRDKVNNAIKAETPIIYTGNGDVLCLDSLSGRLFHSSIEKLKRAENILNKRLITENYISLNDLYDEVGLDHIDIGNMLGWVLSKMDETIEMAFRSTLTEDGRPCVVLDYAVGPTYDFRDY